MAIDPSIALQYKPIQVASPMEQMQNVLALKNAQTQNQLGQLNLQSQQTEMSRQNELRQSLAGLDPTTPEGRMAIQQSYLKAGDAKGALEFASNAAKIDKDTRDSALAKIKLDQEHLAAVSQTAAGLFSKPDLSFSDVQAAEQDLVQKGHITPQESSAQLAQWQADPAYAANPMQFLRSKLGQLAQQGMSAHDQLEAQKPHYDAVKGGDYGQTVAVTPGAPFSGTAPTAAVVPGSRYVINESPNTAARIAANPATAGHPLTAQAMLDGRIPLGRVNSRTAALYEEALSVDPDADLTALNNSQLGEAAGARTAGSTQANIAIASDEARRMIGVAREFAANLDTGKYPNLNAIENAISKGTGDVNIVKLHTALNAVINSYARAINPKGTPTVSDKNHAREIVSEAMSKGQIGGAFDVMEQEMTASNAAATAGTAPKPHGATAKAAVASSGVDTNNPLLK